jgi:hypothetical protein
MTDAQVLAPAAATTKQTKIAASIVDKVHGVRMWITPLLTSPIRQKYLLILNEKPAKRKSSTPPKRRPANRPAA